MCTGSILAALLLTQFLDNEPGRATDDGPCAWALAIYMGDPDGMLGSWL